MDLSRIARGGIPITLDRPRLLYFDMAALWLLIGKYGNSYLKELYGVPPKNPNVQTSELVLNSMEALQFYLWSGLQADCTMRGEELTLDQAGEFITPVTYPRIFDAVISALMRDAFTPARKGEDASGKAGAAPAGAAAVANPAPKPKRSTSRKKNDSRSAPSAGRPKGSGQAL